MGYYSGVGGTLHITDTEAALAAANKAPLAYGFHLTFTELVDNEAGGDGTQVFEHGDGTATIWFAHWEKEHELDTFFDAVAPFVESYQAESGVVHVKGEDDEDFRRYVFVDGTVRCDRPTLVWPPLPGEPLATPA